MLLEDFERGLREVGEADGPWVSYDDASAGEFLWETTEREASESPGLGGAGPLGRELHIRAADFAEWSGFGLDLGTALGAGAPCAFDASAFDGVRFKARGRGAIRVRAASVGGLPLSDGGTCVEGEACYDQPGAFVRLEEGLRTIELPFCGLRVQGWGAAEPRFDASELVGLHFIVQSTMQRDDFEMWMDDIEFYKAGAEGELDCQVGCPVRSVPNLDNIDPEFSALVSEDGGPLTLSTFEQETVSCGTMTRRYLSYLPKALKTPTDAPVVIFLHGYGANAESSIDFQTHGRLNQLADADGFVAVYGNAAPSYASSPDADFFNSGAWRHAESDDRQLDDVDYLRRVIKDLAARGITSGKNEVMLSGLSNGGGMVLKAANEMSEEIDGVAAFMPHLGVGSPSVPDLREARLSRVLFMYTPGDPGLPRSHDVQLPAHVRSWVDSLGLSSVTPASNELADLVDEGAMYQGAHPVVLATRQSSARQEDFQSEDQRRKVRVFVLTRAGHFLPSPIADTEAWILERWGLRNQDIDASEVLWDFFKGR
jgi:polyhydroxybutyrate depolymerase